MFTQVDVLLKVIHRILEEERKRPNIKRKVIKQAFECLKNLLEKHNCIQQIVDMDMNDFLQYVYGTEQLNLMIISNKIIGQLMSGDEQLCVEVMSKIPHIHRFILQAITQVDLNDNYADPSINRLRQLFIKESLWALSNIAACNYDIIQQLIDDRVFDEVIRLLMTVGYQIEDIF